MTSSAVPTVSEPHSSENINIWRDSGWSCGGSSGVHRTSGSGSDMASDHIQKKRQEEKVGESSTGHIGNVSQHVVAYWGSGFRHYRG